MIDTLALFGLLILLAAFLGWSLWKVFRSLTKSGRQKIKRIAKGMPDQFQPSIPDEGIRKLIAEGDLTEAVKTYRLVTGVDEYAARDAVKKLQEQMTSLPQDNKSKIDLQSR